MPSNKVQNRAWGSNFFGKVVNATKSAANSTYNAGKSLANSTVNAGKFVVDSTVNAVVVGVHAGTAGTKVLYDLASGDDLAHSLLSRYDQLKLYLNYSKFITISIYLMIILVESKRLKKWKEQ